MLRYYLGGGYRWATTLGPVPDPLIFDWRDAVAPPEGGEGRSRRLDALLATVPPGGEFVVFAPVFRDYRAWRATWTKLVWRKSIAWTWLLQHDPAPPARRSTSRRDEIALQQELLQAAAGVCLSPSRLAWVRSRPGGRRPISMTKDTTQTTLVLGGGPAGLTAGYLLGQARTATSLVLEAEDQVGGLAKTVERDGYRFDLGGHRFFTKSIEVDDALARGARRRVPPAAAHVAHLLEQPLPRLPAARPRRDQEARPGRARALHGLVPARRRSPRQGRRARSRTG